MGLRSWGATGRGLRSGFGAANSTSLVVLKLLLGCTRVSSKVSSTTNQKEFKGEKMREGDDLALADGLSQAPEPLLALRRLKHTKTI